MFFLQKCEFFNIISSREGVPHLNPGLQFESLSSVWVLECSLHPWMQVESLNSVWILEFSLKPWVHFESLSSVWVRVSSSNSNIKFKFKSSVQFGKQSIYLYIDIDIDIDMFVRSLAAGHQLFLSLNAHSRFTRCHIRSVIVWFFWGCSLCFFLCPGGGGGTH